MFDKIMNFLGGTAVKEIGSVVDNLTTSTDEKSAAKAALSSIVLDALNKGMEMQADVLKTEMQGNWLQRSWRPITMLTFTAIIVVGAFREIPFLESSSPYWNLIELGLGGYVIGRSVEKVADSVTKNADLPFLKKKNR
jgi:hypothetical protein